MDPILVNGIIGGLSLAVSIFGWATKRMVSNFDTVTKNNTAQTQLLSDLVGVVTTVKVEIVALKALVMDDRLTAATKAQETANAAMHAALELVTGQLVARPVTGEEPAEAPPTVRRRSGSRPG